MSDNINYYRDNNYRDNNNSSDVLDIYRMFSVYVW